MPMGGASAQTGKNSPLLVIALLLLFPSLAVSVVTMVNFLKFKNDFKTTLQEVTANIKPSGNGGVTFDPSNPNSAMNATLFTA